MTDMKSAPFLVLKFDHDENAVVLLKTPTDAMQWATAEIAFWTWMNEARLPQELQQIRTAWLSGLERFRTAIQNYLQLPDQQRSSEKANVEAHALNLTRTILPSVSEKAQYAAAMNEEKFGGAEEAMAALAVFTRWNSASDNGAMARIYSQFLGYAKAARYLQGSEPKTLIASHAVIQKLLEETKDYVDRQRQLIEDTLSVCDNQAKAFSTAAGSLLEKSGEESKTLFEHSQSKFQEQLNALMAVTKTFEEQMALESPVRYWKVRARTHDARSALFSRYLLSASAASFLVLLCVFMWVKSNLVGTLDIDHFFYVAIGVLATTSALWILRVILKIVLSERHLRQMAEEKAMLIQTYLALTKVSGATPEDRPLVLPHIFNSSSDGIVKDDGGPELTIAGLLSKLLAK